MIPEAAVPVRRRVLFVDDEPRILEGLQRMLRPQRQQLEVLIAPGGAEALAVLERERVDAVVSDMRMPRMDGAELLSEVRTRHPESVRVILSGQSDLDTILRSVGTTHQFLAKPCDPQVLLRTVTTACNRRDLIGDRGLQAQVSRLATVGALPERHAELVATLTGSEPSLRRAAQIIASDPGMAAKAMQLVSSTFFGQPRRVSGPDEAVRLLGLDILRGLAGSPGAFTPIAPAAGLDHRSIAASATAISSAAKAIAGGRGASPRDADDAGIAGLLHNLGRLILADGGVDASAVPAAGASLLGLWGIPDPVVDAVACQRAPSRAPAASSAAAGALHAALALVDACPWDEAWLAGAGGAEAVAAMRTARESALLPGTGA